MTDPKTQTTNIWVVAILCVAIGGGAGIKGTLIGVAEAKHSYDQQVYDEWREKTSGLIIKLDGSGDVILNGLDLCDGRVCATGQKFSYIIPDLFNYYSLYAVKRLERGAP